MNTTSNSASRKRRRRWFRFSLRTFLILIAVFAIPLGWYVNRAERQRRATEKLRDKGAFIQYSADNRAEHPMISDLFRKPRSTKEWIPIDYWSTVTAVSFFKRTVKMDDLSSLTDLSSLQTLDISSFEGHDVAPIEKLTNLKRLDLGVGPDYVDLSPLTKLKHLDELHIHTSAKSTDDAYAIWVQVKSLRIAMPNCRILFNQ